MVCGIGWLPWATPCCARPLTDRITANAVRPHRYTGPISFVRERGIRASSSAHRPPRRYPADANQPQQYPDWGIRFLEKPIDSKGLDDCQPLAPRSLAEVDNAAPNRERDRRGAIVHR